MIYLRAIFLFSLVALHLIGGAALFRRIFPRESPWLGFIIPGLTIALVCNCLEHAIALTWLACLLPFTAMGFVWLLVSLKTRWRFLWKPTAVFLLCFAIPFIAWYSTPSSRSSPALSTKPTPSSPGSPPPTPTSTAAASTPTPSLPQPASSSTAIPPTKTGSSPRKPWAGELSL